MLHFGDIYYADLSQIPNGMHIQSGRRPVIVISNDACNYYSSVITIVPLTSQLKKLSMPTHVMIQGNGLEVPSMALCEQIMTIDKRQLTDKIGRIDSNKTLNKMHRLFKLKEYKPGKLVLGKKEQRAADDSLYARGEKPDALLDFPVDATDYEAVDVFNWQEEAEGMISQMEFVRRVDVQSETVERYIREGKILPDLVVPMSEHKQFKYFKEETLEAAAEKFGWKLINDDNRKELFMDMVRQMDMSYSYKPVLIKAVLEYADNSGRVKLDDIVAYFRMYYEGRREKGLVVEKSNSLFAKGGYTDKEAQRNILSNPFKRFEDMQMLRHTKTLGIVEVEPTVWKNLTDDEKNEIRQICEDKLESYFSRDIK